MAISPFHTTHSTNREPEEHPRSISFELVNIARLEREADEEARKIDEANDRRAQNSLNPRTIRQITRDQDLPPYVSLIRTLMKLPCTFPDWEWCYCLPDGDPVKIRAFSPTTHNLPIVRLSDDLSVHSSSSGQIARCKISPSKTQSKFPDIKPDWQMEIPPSELHGPTIRCFSPTQWVAPTHDLNDMITCSKRFDRLTLTDLAAFIRENKANPNLSQSAIPELKALIKFLEKEKIQDYKNIKERKIAFFKAMQTLLFSRSFNTKARIFLATRLFLFAYEKEVWVNQSMDFKESHEFFKKLEEIIREIQTYASHLQFGSYAPYELFVKFEKTFRGLERDLYNLPVQKQEPDNLNMRFTSRHIPETPKKEKIDPFNAIKIELPISFDQKETGTPSSSSVTSSSFRSISGQPTFTLVDISAERPTAEQRSQIVAVEALSCSASVPRSKPVSHTPAQNNAVISNKQNRHTGVRV